MAEETAPVLDAETRETFRKAARELQELLDVIAHGIATRGWQRIDVRQLRLCAVDTLVEIEMFLM